MRDNIFVHFTVQYRDVTFFGSGACCNKTFEWDIYIKYVKKMDCAINKNVKKMPIKKGHQ